MSSNEHRGATGPGEPGNPTRTESGVSGATGGAACVDLPEDLQVEIRTLARALPTLDYYAVLGVRRDAEHADIRDAFFERSKRFHPDRYFKKQVGPYGELLHEIYKRVVAAHDVLRDVKLRASYDKTLAAAPPRPSSRPSTVPSTPRPQTAKATTAGRPGSLRSRLGLQSPGMLLLGLQKQLEGSRSKAIKHFESARELKQKGDWARAAELIELALVFDPREKRYHDELADILPRANAERASDARRKAELLLPGDRAGAVELLEEAAQLSPTDAELAHRLSLLLFELGLDLEKAALYGERAVSLEEDELRYRKTIGQIYRKAGNAARARKHLQRAWEIDPTDKDVKAALSAL